MQTIEVLPVGFELGSSEFVGTSQLAQVFRVTQRTIQKDVSLSVEVGLPGFLPDEFVPTSPLNRLQVFWIKEIRRLRTCLPGKDGTPNRSGFKGVALKRQLCSLVDENAHQEVMNHGSVS